MGRANRTWNARARAYGEVRIWSRLGRATASATIVNQTRASAQGTWPTNARGMPNASMKGM